MFLPISKEDLLERNIEQLDFILISGDAYIDHPSFGMAIISRLLESHGFKVGIIAQPNMNNNGDFKKLGTPRLIIPFLKEDVQKTNIVQMVKWD